MEEISIEFKELARKSRNFSLNPAKAQNKTKIITIEIWHNNRFVNFMQVKREFIIMRKIKESLIIVNM